MIEALRDVLLVGVGVILTLGFSFAAALWLLDDTILPNNRRGDKPGD